MLFTAKRLYSEAQGHGHRGAAVVGRAAAERHPGLQEQETRTPKAFHNELVFGVRSCGTPSAYDSANYPYPGWRSAAARLR